MNSEGLLYHDDRAGNKFLILFAADEVTSTVVVATTEAAEAVALKAVVAILAAAVFTVEK